MNYRHEAFTRTTITRLLMLLAAATLVVSGVWASASAPTAKDVEAFLAKQRPGPEHSQLVDLAGDFSLTARFWVDRDTPPERVEISRLDARRRSVVGGRVLEVSVGLPDQGFVGTGLLGFDALAGEHWYAWTDTTTTGLEIFRGKLEHDGVGWLEGGRDTVAGRESVRIEIRRENDTEVHDYFALPAGEKPWRYLELRYQPAP